MAVLAGHAQGPATREAAKGGDARGPDLQRILKLRVPVIVKLAERKISLSEVLRLSSGSIVEFYKSSDDPFELLINNRPIGIGVAVKVGENFGIKLTQIGDARTIVRAMGGK